MLDRKELIFRMRVLAAIPLAATVVALAFENYFGPSTFFAAVGQGTRDACGSVLDTAPGIERVVKLGSPD